MRYDCRPKEKRSQLFSLIALPFGIAMKTGTHTQVPLTFASDYRKCSKCLMLNIVIV